MCPSLEPGDVVITEIRGAQAGGNDTYGQWIEVLYSGDEPLDLRGLSIRMYEHGGGGEVVLRMRNSAFDVTPGQFVVLGHHGPDLEDVPSFVDATFFDDFSSDPGDDQPLRPRDLYGAAVLDLEACNVLLDRVVYSDLPDLGSWSLDGAIAPDQDANDDPEAWCNDAEEPPPDGPVTQIGVPGTPGEENRPCL